MSGHTTSIFGEMSSLAAATGSINLGQGFPDTDGPEEMKEIARECIRDGRGNQYPPPHGLPALREAIAAHQKRFYDLDIDGNMGVVVTTGASEALNSAVLALIDDGDEVLVFEPMFDVYAAGISLARGVRVAVPLTGPGLRPDIDRLRAAVTPRTRAILLNSPHNPSGIVFSRAELEAVAAIALEHDLLVISDEAYEHLWFDDHVHIPISTLPGMFDRTITIGSGGKMFSFTGWKVGWASGPTDLIAAVRVVRQHLTYVSGGPFQHAMAHGLGMPDQYYTEYRRSMSEQRDILSAGLASLGFEVIPSQGSYYLTTDVRSVGAPDGLTFCRELPHQVRVVAIPHQVFCYDESVGKPFVRWAFCKRPAVLKEAIDRLGGLQIPWQP
jgi:N-succinyldiaminopimelate aminotransferase